MRLAVILLALAAASHAASCGSSGIPFRFEVLPSGKPVLGCASPTCFGAENAGRDLRHDSSFLAGAEGDDGFFREGDLSRVRVRNMDAPAQQASCPGEFESNSCINPMTWVGGFMADEDGNLKLQCCHYGGLKFAQEVGRPVVHPGEVYSGGEVLRDGRQTGFDAISNVKKIVARDGTVAYELTVTRMNCLPDPVETENEVSFDIQRDIGRILEKVGDTSSAGGVQTNEVGDQRLSPSSYVDGQQQLQPQSDSYAQPQAPQEPQQETEQFVQVGEQVVPVTSAGYYYPVASGVPACFTANSTVLTLDGYKRMEDVRVGDKVLTSENRKLVFTRVASWIHRLPDAKAAFIRIRTESANEINLTPQHFIYKTDCTSRKMDMVYAEDVNIGDCLMIYSEDTMTPSKVVSTSTFYSNGVYAPMTDSGDLIVDNIYASCHNVIKTSTLSHTFLSLVTGLQQKVLGLLGMVDNSGHLPATAEFFLSVVDVLLPHKY
ncbi:unnamed protein product [Caenorhabditis bovis]|uniref:Uncharacterized protein n=1 Tax=Caenorhabditis bovis TaxID=2654633 RepID=A0A8S1FB58_9PELO|nr:unnamed protein product [Caenorhabditis bovis]